MAAIAMSALVGVVPAAGTERAAGPAPAAGTILWVNRRSGPGAGFDGARSLVVSPDGSMVFVTGASERPGTGLDYLTEAIDASTGATMWTSRFNAAASGDDSATALAITPDGSSLFVTGSSDGGASTGLDYATVSLNAATGAVRWVRRYNGPGSGADGGTALVVSPDGATVYVTGSSAGVASGADYATQAINTASGAVRWVRRYNGPGNGADTARSVAVTPDGATVVVTGQSDGGSVTGADYATEAISAASGVNAWVARFDGQAHGTDGAVGVATATDGSRVFVTGTVKTVSAGDNIGTFAYNTTTGSVVWQRSFSQTATGDDEAVAIGVPASGDKVVVNGSGPGTSSDSTDFEMLVYDPATGTKIRGNAVEPIGAVDRALAVSDDGTKIAEGGQFVDIGTNSVDYYVAEWSGTTRPRGMEYAALAGGTDSGYAAAFSPDGTRLYVTGQSEGTSTGYDYATVAFIA
ncbi:MAG: hypothetical protein JO246_09535 [Frankiaceae bacterium]|nr:hypothetical protein [Frankiaceae bacterium]MBV9870534.1 hypothetical protein [Frankiaceae bacterium]